jgi:hypothetical protein
MFRPVSLALEKKLREHGSLQLRMLPVPYLFSQPDYQKSSNVIIYRGSIHDSYPTSIFKCNLTLLKKMFIIEDLDLHGGSVLDEASVHFFLGWILEEVINWAKDAGKDMVVVDTDLPHITEWFVDHNWKFSTREDSVTAGRRYHGTKIIEEASASK